MPAAQSAAIRERERALASHADAIQTAVRQSGSVGGLAFLDARDGRLVVLPGDSPADAWARVHYLAGERDQAASVPAVVTFVYRADVPKAPEAVTQSALQQQQPDVRGRSRDRAPASSRRDWALVQRELAATKQDTDKAVLADSARHSLRIWPAVRKFMLQTAQLGWLNHELTVENASGIRKMAAASQELAASSARLEETLRQLRRSSPASSRSWRPGSTPFRARSRTSSEAADASRRPRETYVSSP